MKITNTSKHFPYFFNDASQNIVLLRPLPFCPLVISFFFFFCIWVFFHKHSRFTGQQGKGEAISLSPLYHFHPLYRHLDIGWAITAESSPLHITSSRTRTENLWFPSARRFPSASRIYLKPFSLV